MKKEFIPYEQALELKALGFDERCIASYRLNRENQWVFNIIEQNGLNWIAIKNSSLVVSCTAPLYQQAFKWFREKYEIFNPQRFIFGTVGGRYGLQSHDEHDQVDGYFDTYEEAELACLKKLIEILKNK